jgi:hypothetical protein
MAQKLIEQWQLAVLRVELDVSRREPTVAVSMSDYPDGSARTLWTRHHHPHDFGVTGEGPRSLKMPTRLRDKIVETLVFEMGRESALWLRLVAPYGYLGAVPWEAALVEMTNVPILRVPDRLPMPPVRGQIWTTAFAVDAAPESDWAAPYVRSLVNRLLGTVPARVEVDIFADANTTAALRGGAAPLPDQVRLHDPFDAGAAARRGFGQSWVTGSGLSEPVSAGGRWAGWIGQGLKGRAVSALHLLLEGALDEDDPVLALSRDPTDPAPRSTAGWITPTDVLPLFDSLGAATVVFCAPDRPGSDVPVRMFADAVGQQRAATTIFSSLALDPAGDILARAEAFLADSAGEIPAPRDPSMFVYVQPEHVQDALREQVPLRPELVTAAGDDLGSGSEAAVQYQSDATLAERFRYAETVPSWVASSDQYLGSQWADIFKTAQSEIPVAPARNAYDKGAAAALADLQAIVERHARPQ